MSLLYQNAREFGLDLTPVQLQRFDDLARMLVEWNSKFNLTAITEYTAIQIKHFLDSLSAAPILIQEGYAGRSLIDVGAGAGFPGLPLAIAFPELHVTLLEATGKKVRFIDQAALELGLANVTTLNARAEEFGRDPKHRERYDYAVARALAPMPTLVEYTLPFIRVGGLLIAYKALEAKEETEAAMRAIEILGGRLREIQEVKLADLDDVRQLVVVDKINKTPDTYPRGGGAPRNRPL